ncbi:ceramide kinase-like protein [Ruditapes philippinarum]|uniref:ceramide kinase-like protein n=1 Tax=Ruditapes philippinarum TaxID=129788 RepID=UPI00295ADC2B|nr:ceramide kinase-like protein [Ruditapes philippinarum]
MTDLEEYIFDEDGNPILQCPNFPQEEQLFADEDDCKDIFHIKGDGYDVTLSLARGLITWSNVNPSGKKKGLFKGKGKGEDKNTVMLKEVFGVKTKRKKSNLSSSEEGVCVGFSVHVADAFGPNTLSERLIVFEHPSEALCSMYVRKINMYMEEMHDRPKSVKLFLQTHAGSKNGSAVYKNKVTPLFQAADVHVDCVEVQHNEHIKQEMVHINLDDYDCIVAMGGDGTVSKVADGLLTASQKRKDIDQKSGFTPVKAAIPLGIIPIGSTNDTGRSVMGTDDVISAALYIILGRCTAVDICSVYREDRLMQWCFNCQYGFAGNVLTFRKRYKSLGKRGLEPAFIKALTKAKLRPYKCDVEYIPADSLPKNRKFLPCYRGCDVCWHEEVVDDNGVTEDLVQAFDPLAESNNSDTLVNLAEHEDTPWRSRKSDFLNIGLFTIPGRSELAPRGMSKYSHLNDGAIDLVLVKDAPRKEFIRMLKRLTNAKNQLDFPFVEVLRVKEVRFRLRLPTGFKYNDTNFNEIDYELERRKNLIDNASKSDILELSELSDSDDDDALSKSNNSTGKTVQSISTTTKSKPPFKKSQSVQQISSKLLKRTNTETSIKVKNMDDSEDSDDDDLDDDDDSDNSGDIVSINSVGVRTVKSASAADQKLCGPAYRPTFAEQDRARRNRRLQKKEEKKKAKEEMRMKSVWNIDNEIKEEDVLSFRVHHGLLKIYGQGVSPDTVVYEPTLLCIPRM